MNQRKSSLNDGLEDIEMLPANDSPLLDGSPLDDRQTQGFTLRIDNEDSDSDMESSGEEADMVLLPVKDDKAMNLFRQLDYLWLFNPYMQFNERPNFKLDEGSLTAGDYDEMKLLNRMLLTAFLGDVEDMVPLDEAAKKFSEVSKFDLDQEHNHWCPESIDEELKVLLRTEANGN